MKKNLILGGVVVLFLMACGSDPKPEQKEIKEDNTAARIIEPLYVTEMAKHDTDDPCIWINKEDPSKSLVIGTDKDEDGALYVYDLKGKIVEGKVVRGLKRPNNVDLEYGFAMGDSLIDIAVTSERLTHQIKVFEVPSMKLIGSIDAFEGETQAEYRDLMGIALYKDPGTDEISVIIGRKSGPTDGSYLWQYQLYEEAGEVRGKLVRKFGKFSGKKEIEAIVVDDPLGYVYYSDEGVGVRKYLAHPDSSNRELANFGIEGILEDNEGLSIYQLTDSSGYLLLSNQAAGTFHIFKREGSDQDPHQHELLKVVELSTLESDGSEATSVSLNKDFKGGLFVAMSEGKVFHYYKWTDIAGEELEVRR